MTKDTWRKLTNEFNQDAVNLMRTLENLGVKNTDLSEILDLLHAKIMKRAGELNKTK